jgi:hypothetical protein
MTTRYVARRELFVEVKEWAKVQGYSPEQFDVQLRDCLTQISCDVDAQTDFILRFGEIIPTLTRLS